VYQVSRATLTKALSDGTISAKKTDAGHWQIEPVELARVYSPRSPDKTVSQTKPYQVDRSEPDQKTVVDHDLTVRLARAEAALDAEREKTTMLQRHVDDLRRMLPSPDARPRRRWWPW
jgi:hypothetical protein